jgi:hypothetical protein
MYGRFHLSPACNTSEYLCIRKKRIRLASEPNRAIAHGRNDDSSNLTRYERVSSSLKGILVKLAISTAAMVFLLVCASIPGFGQADMEARAAEFNQALIKGHIAWKTKLSSPGASFRAKESERQGRLVSYNLYVSGLPTDKLYKAMTWPVGQAAPLTLMEGVSIVMCAGRLPGQCVDSSTKDGPIDFAFNPAKGEPYRLALVSGDYRVAVVIVPDPITAKDKGCTLSVERLLPHFELAYFTGSGFSPNSDATFDGQSYDEKHSLKTKVDNDGNIRFGVSPFVSGHQKGTTTMKGVGMNCSPSIKFDWGQ